MDYPNSVFHKNFQRIDGRKENHSFIGSAEYMSILLIAAPHIEEFIVRVYDEDAFALNTKTPFCQIP